MVPIDTNKNDIAFFCIGDGLFLGPSNRKGKRSILFGYAVDQIFHTFILSYRRL
jgi:hypothetical protein